MSAEEGADTMTTQPLSEWECHLSAPNYDDEILHDVHDQILAWPDEGMDAGDMQGYALEFIAQIRQDQAELATLRTAHAAALELLSEAEDLLIWATGYGDADDYPPIRRIVDLIPRIHVALAEGGAGK